MSNIVEIKKTITQMSDQFRSVLPDHVTPEKFVRVVNTAIMNNPNLANLDRKSLLSACMASAKDGLLPDGQEAALVPFKGSVRYTPMVGGILKKVRNSGELLSLTSQVVYKNDKFEYWIDEDGEHLKHHPMLFGDRGSKLGVYAMAKTKSGGRYIEFMDSSQVMAVKGVSSARGGPWAGPFEDEMWKKSAIRRLAKRLPMSTDLENTIKQDDSMYDFNQKPAAPVDVTPEAPQSAPLKLKAAIKAKPAPKKKAAKVVAQAEPEPLPPEVELLDADEELPV